MRKTTMKWATSAALLAPAIGASPQQGDAAEYEVQLDATWSHATHPGAYAAGAHFSTLVGASHADSFVLWSPGGIATPGLESVAETGETSTLSSEIDAAIAAGLAGDLALGASTLVYSPGTTRTRVTVTEEHPLVSVVSMIGPSPDWFVGVHGLDLRDEHGLWRDNVVVQLFPYDAGTDNGMDFIWPNQDTVPQEPISLMTVGPLAPDIALGTFTFTRKKSVQLIGCGVNPAGSLTIDAGLPQPGSAVDLSLHDPLGTLQTPAITALAFSLAPDPLFPCGTLVPDLGLTGSVSPGEFLIGLPLVSATSGPLWNGSPAQFGVPIPPSAPDGMYAFVQGFLLDPEGRLGATDAVELLIGN